MGMVTLLPTHFMREADHVLQPRPVGTPLSYSMNLLLPALIRGGQVGGGHFPNIIPLVLGGQVVSLGKQDGNQLFHEGRGLVQANQQNISFALCATKKILSFSRFLLTKTPFHCIFSSMHVFAISPFDALHARRIIFDCPLHSLGLFALWASASSSSSVRFFFSGDSCLKSSVN